MYLLRSLGFAVKRCPKHFYHLLLWPILIYLFFFTWNSYRTYRPHSESKIGSLTTKADDNSYSKPLAQQSSNGGGGGKPHIATPFPTLLPDSNRPARVFPATERYQGDPSHCWTDADFHDWREGKYYPQSKPKGNIVYMVMTGDHFLRTRCDVMMCTFGVTLHPSRLFFVGETASDCRLPVYDVVRPGTNRPVDRSGSMQKLGQGLAMIVKKISETSYNNEIDWIMVMDDDTFVSPLNLQSVLAEYDSQRPLMVGQSTCGVAFCGGAGYAISKSLFVQFPRFIRKCHPHDGLGQSDQFVPNCIRQRVKVDFVNRIEFHSEAPPLILPEQIPRDPPKGTREAVSFHHVRSTRQYITLWRTKLACL